MRGWLGLIIFVQSTWALASPLTDRLAGFSEISESKGSFVETWSADYLDEPLISKGELTYKRPSQLIKYITHPESIEQRIDDDQLLVVHDKETRIIQLAEQPELAVSIYAIQALLDGDEQKIHEYFTLKYSELNTGWNLSLIPKDQQIAESIESIVLQGLNNRIYRINIQFYNGDDLLTEITY